MAEAEAEGTPPSQGARSARWMREQRCQELESARELATQAHSDSQRVHEECRRASQRLEELEFLESQLLKHIALRIKENPALVREKSWVGIDVNADELAEEEVETPTEEESLPESGDVNSGKEEEDEEQIAQNDDAAIAGAAGLENEDDAIGGAEASEHQISLENTEGKENEDPLVSLAKLRHELAQVQALAARERAALDEKTRTLETILREGESLAHVIEEEESAIEAMDADETVQQAIWLEQEMRALTADIDRLERLCQDLGVTDPAVLDLLQGGTDDGGGRDVPTAVAAEYARLQEEKGRLEREAKEKQAMLELVGQLLQLRSVGNSAESTTKDLEDDQFVEPPETGMKDFVHGHHGRSGLLAAKRLDFETIDFDQFGDQPPDLPLSDDLDEDEAETKGAQNRENEDDVGNAAETAQTTASLFDARSESEKGITEAKDKTLETTQNQAPKITVPKNTGAGSEEAITQGGSPHQEPGSNSSIQKEENSSKEDGSMSPLLGAMEGAPPLDPEATQSGEPDSGAQDPSPEICGHITDENRTRPEDDGIKALEGDGGAEPPAGLESQQSAENGVLQPRGSSLLGDGSKTLGEASSGGSTRRLKRKIEGKVSSADDENTQKRSKELDRLTVTHAKEVKELGDHIDALTTQLDAQTKLREDLKRELEQERGARLRSEAELAAATACTLAQQVELRAELEQKLEQERGAQLQIKAELAAASVRALAQQAELRAELEQKLEQEREERLCGGCTKPPLPLSSMPSWSDETGELGRLLEQQRELLASQVTQAAKLRSAAEQKVGLLNHQVQDLEVLTDIAESMETVFRAKERILWQALWTVLQALLLCIALAVFVNKLQDQMRTSLLPT